MIELHLHLDGSLRPATVYELAEKQGVDLGTHDLETLTDMMRGPDDCPSLHEYLKRFDIPLLVLQEEDAVERVTFELVEDLAKEGMTYAEIRFAPQLSTEKGLTQEKVCEAAIRGAKKGMEAYPSIRVGLILCCMRGADLREKNLKTVEMAHKYLGDVVCAADLAGAESLFPTEWFEELFLRAQELNVPFTIHAGEAAGADSVYKALSYGTRRIGHGIHSIEDPALIKKLIEEKITLEVCVKSNWQTSCSPALLSEHPLKKLFDAGVRVTVNSDNRTVANTTLQAEIDMIKRELGFSDAEIAVMQQYAKEAAFLK